ncbi:PHP domain-containing protein [Paenibacillus sp. GCM10023252]|uniref:PHP domain-containing protein n=1 Tax=Paenibacillus sp. GCM10023252 TaxID=3252649 RepID=UPI00361C94A6
MAIERADLHTHTTASDGMDSPSSNVRLAAEAGLSGIAITDHDTVAGIEEAIREGQRLGLTVIPGVELSTVARGNDIHILGYFIRWQDEEWLTRLRSLRDTRNKRNEMIVDRLVQLGVPVTMEQVIEIARQKHSGNLPGSTVGRPHIAEAIIRAGAAATMQEAFDRYLAVGAAAYVNPPRIDPVEALKWIHEAGGASVIAHPGLYHDDELVEEIIKQGVTGIEVYHSDHGTPEETRYSALAAKYGLITTGGSDYHGARNGTLYHGAVGSRWTSMDAVRRLSREAGGSSDDGTTSLYN